MMRWGYAGQRASRQRCSIGIVDDWMSEDDEEENPLREGGKRLKEKVGHTPLEVLSGALLGILMAMIFPVT